VPIRVLLVDDVDAIRRLLRTALRVREGFEVIGEAEDGGTAVALAATLRPDIVVLDLGLPDLAGREVLTRIREQSPTSKVVVFSGTESPDRAWIADQVEGYIVKGEDDIGFLVDLLEHLGQRPDRVAVLPLFEEPESVGRARDFVRGALQGWNISYLADDALIVVSELVTNAIKHAHSACELRVSASETSLRIEVTDEGPGTPDPRGPSSDAENGRGLYLIAGLTTAWGVELGEVSGKVVWAELRRELQ
jgi:CheY-like chemotaxis protein